jgi:hypothetical protein
MYDNEGSSIWEGHCCSCHLILHHALARLEHAVMSMARRYNIDDKALGCCLIDPRGYRDGRRMMNGLHGILEWPLVGGDCLASTARATTSSSTNFSAEQVPALHPSIPSIFLFICAHYFIPLLVAYRRLCGGCYSQLVLALLVRDEASPTTEKTTALGHRSTRQRCLPVPTVGLSPTREHCVNWRY